MQARLTVALTLTTFLPLQVLADDAEAPPAPDEEYVVDEPALDLEGWDDPAYSRMVDFALLGEAVASGDASVVTDVALQMGHAEKVLLRPHPKLTSTEILDTAVNVARNENDKQALQRIARVAKARGLDDVAKKVQVAMTLGGASRAIEPPPALTIDTDPEVLIEVRRLGEQIEAAENAGDKELLSGLLADVVLGDLPEAHQKWLEKRINVALESTKNEGSTAMGMLVAGTRGGGLFGGALDPSNRNNVTGISVRTPFRKPVLRAPHTPQSSGNPVPYTPRRRSGFQGRYQRAPGARINNNGTVYTNNGRYLGKARVGRNPRTGRRALVYTSPNGKRLVRRFSGGNRLESGTYRRRR